MFTHVSTSSNDRISIFEVEDLTKRRILICPGNPVKLLGSFPPLKNTHSVSNLVIPFFKETALVFCPYL